MSTDPHDSDAPTAPTTISPQHIPPRPVSPAPVQLFSLRPKTKRIVVALAVLGLILTVIGIAGHQRTVRARQDAQNAATRAFALAVDDENSCLAKLANDFNTLASSEQASNIVMANLATALTNEDGFGPDPNHPNLQRQIMWGSSGTVVQGNNSINRIEADPEFNNCRGRLSGEMKAAMDAFHEFGYLGGQPSASFIITTDVGDVSDIDAWNAENWGTATWLLREKFNCAYGAPRSALTADCG